MTPTTLPVGFRRADKEEDGGEIEAGVSSTGAGMRFS